MYKNNLNLLFSTTLILGVYIMLSSKTWFSAWLGLEINLLSFTPLIILSPSNPSEAGMKYFLIQAIASLMIIQASFIWSILLTPYTMIIMALSLKLGVAPFHFWLPLVCEKISWGVNMILLTIQKIGPFFLLSSFSFFLTKMILLMSTLSVTVGALGGLNELFLRKLLAFSSISHMGWIMFAMMIKPMIWIIYLSIYTLISLTLMSFLSKFSMFHLSQTIQNPKNMIPVALTFLSLGGLPPLLGFAPKWMVIYEGVNFSMTLTFFLIMSSVVTLFFYLRSGLVMFLLTTKEFKIKMIPFSSLKDNLFYVMNMLGGLTYMMIWSSFML